MNTPILEIGDILTLLRFNIRNRLKQDFVAKDQIIDLMLVSVITREHLLLIGPPGTAKSELVKRFVRLLGAHNNSGELFEYMLTRFTEPNEIFGPVNIKEFQAGTFTRNIARALPEARIAFLDEIFKANSAILNSLLTILNERMYFNGLEQTQVPLLSMFGAANDVPDTGDLAALYDRFLLRARTDNVEERRVRDLLTAGWSIERERIRLGRAEEIAPVFDSLERLTPLYDALERIDLEPIFDTYGALLHQIRAEGISISDRRAIKVLKLIAASTLLRGEQHASPADFWVLLHVWNRPEQESTLRALVAPIVEQAGGLPMHDTRSLDDLADDLTRLEKRVAGLSPDTHTDARRVSITTSYAALIHELERTRQDILDHSSRLRQDESATRRQTLLEQIDALTDKLLDQIERG